jgi:3-carboxymuconate cyclase
MLYQVYAGAYTDKENTEGIYHLELDTEKERLRVVRSYRESDSPSFLAVTPDYLYAVSEREDSNEGMVSAYRRNRENGELHFINSIVTRGTAMCHINVWPDGKHFSAANYMSGSVFTGRIREDGSIDRVCAFCQHESTGAGANPVRQDGPHVHCTQLSEDGRRLYVADLGLDWVFCYDIGKDASLMPVKESAQIHLPAGEGPRHLVFRNQGRFLYLTAELGNKVFVYETKDGGETYENIQTVSTLPDGYEGVNTAADIHFSRDGRFLYVSNRGMDSIALYEADCADGVLKAKGHYGAFGRCPRNFCVTPDNGYLLIANQESGNIVLCKRNADTGELCGKKDEIEMKRVAFVTVPQI